MDIGVYDPAAATAAERAPGTGDGRRQGGAQSISDARRRPPMPCSGRRDRRDRPPSGGHARAIPRCCSSTSRSTPAGLLGSPDARATGTSSTSTRTPRLAERFHGEPDPRVPNLGRSRAPLPSGYTYISSPGCSRSSGSRTRTASRRSGRRRPVRPVVGDRDWRATLVRGLGLHPRRSRTNPGQAREACAPRCTKRPLHSRLSECIARYPHRGCGSSSSS